MIKTIFDKPKYKLARKYALEQASTNFVGLVQIKNYSSYKNLIREILILIKNRPLNLLNVSFWFFSLGTIVVPRSILKKMVDNFKNTINARRYRNLQIDF